MGGGSYGQSRGGIWDNNDGSPANAYQAGGSQGQPQHKQKSPAIQKVEHDLDVFVDSIVEGENRLRRGDFGRETQDLVRNLQEMKPKIEDLCMKLSSAGEYEAADKARNSGRKLVAFLDAYQNGQRSVSGGGGLHTQASGSQGGSQQANFFGDFGGASSGGNAGQAQTISFDNFNQFGQTAQPPPQPKQSQGGDFWSQAGGAQTQTHQAPQQQPQVSQASGGFFDQHFDGNASGGFSGPAQTGLSKSGGDGFFEAGFGGGHQTHTQPPQHHGQPQRHQADDLNLLGLDSGPGQTGGQQGQAHLAAFDLLAGAGMGQGGHAHAQPTHGNFSMHSNPFGPGGQMGRGGAPMPMGGQAGMGHGFQFGGAAPTLGMTGQPTMGQQGAGHFGVYNQPQFHLGGHTGGNPGGQAHFGNMAFGGGGQMGQGFGGANSALYTADAYRAATDKRNQADPFGDLTSDLV